MIFLNLGFIRYIGVNGLKHEERITFLKNNFSFDEFRPGQEEVITALQRGQDTLAVLPTGSGKTLIYQYYGLLTHQKVLIVSPLISLMQDQVSRLQAMGSRQVVAITSMLSYAEKQFILSHLSAYQYIYLSPEMLTQPEVIEALKRAEIGLFVIDEAHCVSEWGPDFRPDYLSIKDAIEALNHPVTLMLSATADEETRTDILAKLNLQIDAVYQVVESVNRSNIFLTGQNFENVKAKDQQLIKIVKQLNGAGIIYFSSKKQAEVITDLLNKKTDKKILAYHADLDADQRLTIQQQFMQNQVDVVCATSAFGMGIDKDNIRYVVHYHLPGNLQNYVQEIGRAGRDGQPSLAILLYAPGDEYIQVSLNSHSVIDSNIIDYYWRHPQPDNESEQTQLLTYYWRHDYEVKKVQQIFKQREFTRQNELQQMLNYVFTRTCRRQFILNYFDEQSVNNNIQDFCCDKDEGQLAWQEFNKRWLKPTKANTSQTQWRTILHQLFLVKN